MTIIPDDIRQLNDFLKFCDIDNYYNKPGFIYRIPSDKTRLKDTIQFLIEFYENHKDK